MTPARWDEDPELVEATARAIHDANTGRITPDPDDPISYATLAREALAMMQSLLMHSWRPCDGHLRCGRCQASWREGQPEPQTLCSPSAPECEVRISPDGIQAALRDDHYDQFPWRSACGGCTTRYSDEQVAGWTKLIPGGAA